MAKATKNKGGRPTKYKPEFAKVAAQMCKLGATDADLAAAFDVTTVTIWNWQSRHLQFFNALKIGKGLPDDKVEPLPARRRLQLLDREDLPIPGRHNAR